MISSSAMALPEDAGEERDVDRVHLEGEPNDLVEVLFCGQLDPHCVCPSMPPT